MSSPKHQPVSLANLPEHWLPWLGAEIAKPYFAELTQFVGLEGDAHSVFPPIDQVYRALELTSPAKTKVLILGQDPYHGEGQAHGLSFSVMPAVKPPPSLKNIFKELTADLGCPVPDHGCLEKWARQGVLLLNTVLTVRANSAHSHQKKGWEQFTDQIIRVVNDRPRDIAFILWGKPAQKKAKLIDRSRHLIIESAHPSPLSAHHGFFGSRPFSKVNDFLRRRKETPIDWCL